MMKKHRFSIEVEINSRQEYWQELASNRMTQILANLKTDVKKLGGKVHIRY